MSDSQFLGHCLVDGDPAVSRQFRRSRLRALATSLSLQAALVAAAVLIPILATADFPDDQTPLPRILYVGTYQTPPSSTQQPARPQHPQPNRPAPTSIVVPTKPPDHIAEINDEASSAPTPPCPNCVPGDRNTTGDPNAPPNSIPDIFSDRRPAPPPIQPPPTSPPVQLRVKMHESILLGKLIHHVDPQYTPILRAMRREGTILLRAVISKDGSITELRVESGDPALAEEARRAIRQWRYRPTLLNGVPVEVETIITVHFKLSQ